jgi:hypothetical protein
MPDGAEPVADQREKMTAVELGVVPSMDASLGRQLRHAREAIGRSRREAAAILGIASLRLHLLEAATTTLTTAEAIAISNLYDLDEPTRQALLTCASADQEAAAALEPVAGPLDDWASLDVLHLVTTGRRTGRRLTRAWPLFAVDASQVLLLAPPGPADWLANIRKRPEVGIGPPGAPRQGVAMEAFANTLESQRQRWLVMRRLGQPPELENGRLVVITIAEEMPLVDW